MKQCRLYIMIVGCLVTGWVQAQTFDVRSFKLLDNDISAYIEPARDLNDEACALVKVVGDKDFVFSSPLGVVARRDKVGEIWIYLPKGSRMITIKHPRWGVWRDYLFDQKLESRLTYELMLIPPLDQESLAVQLRQVKQKPRLPVVPVQKSPVTLPTAGGLTPKMSLTYIAMANVAVHGTDVAWGATFGVMRRHGAYIRALSNFQTVPSSGLEADKDGVLYGGDTRPYYTGASRQARFSVTAGGIQRLARPFYIYEGIGYGNRILAWETSEGMQVRINDYTFRGFTAEVGCMWRGKWWLISLGALTVKTSYWEMVCGAGITF